LTALVVACRCSAIPTSQPDRLDFRVQNVTIHVPEETYRAFQEEAATNGQSASELIRAAMEAYYRDHISSGASDL
jgi:hypothetical protein